MADYKTYLAANILSEDKVVTYRLLSRAIKVHVNAAKEMLYEFHRLQNGKKPGTVHATYLISGTRRQESPDSKPIKKDGEDEYMQSSPFMTSSMPQLDSSGASSVLTITLTKEEDLEKTRAQYEQITSIHIYSLGPHPLKDLQLLSDSTRELQSLTVSEDPVSSLTTYGTITNPGMKRRANRRPPPASAPAPAPAVQAKPKVEAKEPVKIKAEPKSSQQSTAAKDFFGKSGKAASKTTAASSNGSKESTPAPPATLKKETSSLFKSFAKAKPKLKREGTDSSAFASADEPMRDVSDDEEETYVPPAPSSEIVDRDRKSRKEREAALKKMMEDDDEEDDVVPTPEPEPEEEDEEILEVKNEEEPEPVPVVEVKDGRRRGRRRVMKKRTVKDEEGYLVTKEEAVWESFSEDEPAPPPKAKVQASSTGSKKKPATKVGQGNIMSFFGKK